MERYEKKKKKGGEGLKWKGRKKIEIEFFFSLHIKKNPKMSTFIFWGLELLGASRSWEKSFFWFFQKKRFIPRSKKLAKVPEVEFFFETSAKLIRTRSAVTYVRWERPDTCHCHPYSITHDLVMSFFGHDMSPPDMTISTKTCSGHVHLVMSGGDLSGH